MMFALLVHLFSNILQVWSRDRIAAGWTWGAKRDDRKKLHPSLLAYGKLSDDDKQWDRDSAKQTLAVIRALGYDIRRVSGETKATKKHATHQPAKEVLKAAPNERKGSILRAASIGAAAHQTLGDLGDVSYGVAICVAFC